MSLDLKMEKKIPGLKMSRYFTMGRKLNLSNIRHVMTEPNPFKFPTEPKDFSYRVMYKEYKNNKRQEDSSYEYYDRPTFRSRQNIDILERLHIPGDPHEKRALTIIDIDPDFYRVIQGRPIKDKLIVEDCINSMRNILRTRLAAGVRNDVVLQIDERIIQERNKIEKLKRRNRKYVDTFEKFLAEDHEKSMAILKKSEDCTETLRKKDEECKQLQIRLGSTRTRVYALEERWKKLKLYQQFLYEVSPPTWRKEHDPYYIQEISKDSNGVGALVAKESSDIGSDISVTSFDAAINSLTENLAAEKKPKLYFTDPQQLLKVLQDMEVQNLNLLTQSEILSSSVREMKSNLEEAKEQLEEEEKHISEKVKSLQKVIEFEEERDKYIQEHSQRLLSGAYQKLAVSDEALSLQVYVQDTYAACVSSDESNLGILEMMKAIERKYEVLMFQLDSLPADIVKEVKTEVHREEARKLKEAKIAMAKAKRMEKLMNRIKKNMQPKPKIIVRPLRFRSYIKGHRKKKEKKEKQLTEDEKDYLKFFTDYCPYTDSAADYLKKTSSN